MGSPALRLAPGGGPDASGQHTVVAACCGYCAGNSCVRSAADGKLFGCLGSTLILVTSRLEAIPTMSEQRSIDLFKERKVANAWVLSC